MIFRSTLPAELWISTLTAVSRTRFSSSPCIECRKVDEPLVPVAILESNDREVRHPRFVSYGASNGRGHLTDRASGPQKVDVATRDNRNGYLHAGTVAVVLQPVGNSLTADQDERIVR